MAKQLMPIVNASRILHDAEVKAYVAAQQLQYDRDFKPAWGDLVPDMEFVFAGQSDIPNLPPTSWPIFLNRHSSDPGAIGWHTDEGGRIFGRSFIADCLADGISWTTDVSHEALETALDPLATKAWRMPNGGAAAFEACDAVESDECGYMVNGMLLSDFVLRAYFSTQANGPYDFGHRLKAPCPALTAGGYMSVEEPGSSGWTMIQQNRDDGQPSARYLRQGRHRRLKRQLAGTVEFVTL